MKRLLVALSLLTIMFWAFPRFAYADCTPQSCDQYGRNQDIGGGNARAAGEPTGGSGDYSGETNGDRKSTRLNSSHLVISYSVFCFKKILNAADWFRSIRLLKRLFVCRH